MSVWHVKEIQTQIPPLARQARKLVDVRLACEADMIQTGSRSLPHSAPELPHPQQYPPSIHSLCRQSISVICMHGGTEEPRLLPTLKCSHVQLFHQYFVNYVHASSHSYHEKANQTLASGPDLRHASWRTNDM